MWECWKKSENSKAVSRDGSEISAETSPGTKKKKEASFESQRIESFEIFIWEERIRGGGEGEKIETFGEVSLKRRKIKEKNFTVL